MLEKIAIVFDIKISSMLMLNLNKYLLKKNAIKLTIKKINIERFIVIKKVKIFLFKYSINFVIFCLKFDIFEMK